MPLVDSQTIRYHVWPPRARIEIRPDPEAFPTLERRVRFHMKETGSAAVRWPVGSRDSIACWRLAERGRVLRSGPTPELARRSRTIAQCTRALAYAWRSASACGQHRPLGCRVGGSGSHSRARAPQYRHLDGIIVMVGASDVYHWLEEGAPPSRPSAAVPEERLFSITRSSASAGDRASGLSWSSRAGYAGRGFAIPR